MKYSYCYILFSHLFKTYYISSTEDLKSEMVSHNKGKIDETKQGRPWDLVWYGAFTSKQKAEEFENYLKTEEGEKLRSIWFIPFSLQALSEEKPENAITCPTCGGSGKAANDVFFNRYGKRQSANVTTCLTCVEKGWITPQKDNGKL